MLFMKMDLLNYQYLDKMNNNIGILCYEGRGSVLEIALPLLWSRPLLLEGSECLLCILFSFLGFQGALKGECLLCTIFNTKFVVPDLSLQGYCGGGKAVKYKLLKVCFLLATY